MGSIKFHGLDNYMKKLTALEAASDEVIKKALNEGAGIAADEMRRAIEELPTSDSDGKRRWGTPENMLPGPTEAEKQGLLDSLGFTPISVDSKGLINVKIGFDGYNSVKTKRWPNGEPNLLIARSVNSGTSFMEKNSFAKKARSKGGAKARKAMEKTVEKEFKKITKG